MLEGKIRLLCALATVATLASGCALVSTPFNPSPIPTREPITIYGLPNPAPMDLDDTIARTDLIAIGRIVTIEPSRWNTPDGRLPSDVTVKTISPELTIYTESEFQLERTLKGDVQLPSVRIRTFGGQVGRDWMIMEGEPVFTVGEKYLLFLVTDTGSTVSFGPEHYLTLGTDQYLYTITHGKAVSLQDEWHVDDLVIHIQQSLSLTTPSPATTASPIP